MARVEEQNPESIQELTDNATEAVEAFRTAIEAVGIAMQDLSNTVAEQQNEHKIQPLEQYDNVDPVVEQGEVQPIETVESQIEVETVDPVVEQGEVQTVETQIEVETVQSQNPIEIQSQNPFDTQVEVQPVEQSTIGEIVVIPVVNDPESIPIAEAPKAQAETIDESPQIVGESAVQEGQSVDVVDIVEQEDENLSDSDENAELEEYYRQVQNEEYGNDDLEDVSLNDQDSLDACSDTSSQKVKKVGRVRQGFKQVFGGTKQIFVGSGKNISKSTGRAANKGRDTIKGGANFVADGAKNAADSTVNAGKFVASGIKNTTVNVATGISDSAKAVGGAVVDGAKFAGGAVVDGVTTGVCLGVGVTVLGAQAIGKGTSAVAGAIKDGTVAAGGAVIDGVKFTGTTIASNVSEIASAGKDSITDVFDTGRAGVRAVEHGIENAAMKGAAAIQQNTVKALTMGLKMADGSLAVVPKSMEAIEAPAPPQAIEAPITQEVIALPAPEN